MAGEPTETNTRTRRGGTTVKPITASEALASSDANAKNLENKYASCNNALVTCTSGKTDLEDQLKLCKEELTPIKEANSVLVSENSLLQKAVSCALDVEKCTNLCSLSNMAPDRIAITVNTEFYGASPSILQIIQDACIINLLYAGDKISCDGTVTRASGSKSAPFPLLSTPPSYDDYCNKLVGKADGLCISVYTCEH